MEQLEEVSAETLADWHRRYYKPRNAQLIVVGGFDPQKTRALIQEAFGSIKAGDPAPAPAPATPAALPVTREITTPAPESGTWPPGVVAIAFRTPAVSDDGFPAFLMLWSRLATQLRLDIGRHMIEARNGRMGITPLSFAPLDVPQVIMLGMPLLEGEASEAVIDAIQGRITTAATVNEGEALETTLFIQRFGTMFGMAPSLKGLVTQNPYFLAFMIGRHEQMGIDPATLREALERVTPGDLRRCADELFDPSKRAAAVVIIE